uniref:Fanconi anemia group D2 protein n=1 Tax=Syphacia muris TaxID=451379 RepID=A0A0N5AQK5_9BILA
MNERMDAEDANDLFDAVSAVKENSNPCSHASENGFCGLEESLIDEKEFRRALNRFITQSQSIAETDFDIGEPVTDLTDFQKLLSEQFGVELRISEGQKISTYIGELTVIPSDANHSALVKRFEKVFETKEKMKDEFLRLFEAEIDCEDKMRIYLAPSTSERGLLGSFFRAMLLVKQIQAYTFQMLIKKIENFAKKRDSDTKDSVRLALSCVSQIRYLDVVFDPKSIFSAVFSCDFENWVPTVRDSLIQAIPEILLNVTVQQDTAENLCEMFLKGVPECSLEFRSSVLKTLMMLRYDIETSSKIRRAFIRNIMKVDLDILPELVTFCLSSVQKDEKGGFSDFFFGLRKHLKLEKMETSRKDKFGKDVDAIIAKIFVQISKRARFAIPRFWKEVIYVLQHDGEMGDDSNTSLIDVASDNSEFNFKEFCSFDIMLSFSLMSVESCDRLIYSIFKNYILHSRYSREVLMEEIQYSLNFERVSMLLFSFFQFSTQFLPSILAFCEHLMWSFLPNLTDIGSFVLGHLFVVVSAKRSEVLAFLLFIFAYLFLINILSTMLRHLNDIDFEARSILCVLELLSEEHLTDLIPFAFLLQDALNSLSYLSTENVRRIFYVLVAVFEADQNNVEAKVDFELRITRLLSSNSRKERIWGVLGMLMEFQAQLRNIANTDNREHVIEKTLAVLDERTRDDSQVRAIFYSHLTHVITKNPKVLISDAVLEWGDKLQLEFREIFFQNRASTSGTNYYEDSRYVLPEHKEWLCLSELVSHLNSDKSDGNERCERIFELIPFFELLRALARQRQRWEGDDTQKAHEHHWKQFLFAFGLLNINFRRYYASLSEANISMSGVDAKATECSKRRFNNDVFCFAIQWIRLVRYADCFTLIMLNTFSECELEVPELDLMVKELMKKKFLLMIECQKSLLFTTGRLDEYILPHLHGYHKEIIVQKRGNRGRKNCDQRKKLSGNECLIGGDDDVISNVEVGGANLLNEDPYDRADMESNTIVKRDRKRKFDHSRKYIEAEKMLSYFLPFKLLTIAKLLKLLPNKRKQTKFLLECLQKILKELLPRKEKKVVPWILSDMSKVDMPLNQSESKMVWRTVHTLLPLVFTILNNAVEYFKSLHDTTELQDTNQRDCFNDMIHLLNACFFVFKDIFLCKDIAKPEKIREKMKESERDRRARFERRKCVMEKLERVMIDGNLVHDTYGEEEAEVSVLRYFISVGPFIPALDSAVALLGVLVSAEVFPEEERFKTVLFGINTTILARIALSFLKREWVDEDGNPLKGPVLNRAVGDILNFYVLLRKSSKRFLAIQWLLATEVSSLIPEEERRRSKISSLEECNDDELLDEDKRGHFCCFTKGTFSTVYKVLFRSLNDTIKNTLTLQAVVNGEITFDDCFMQWKRAASCFCLLMLMIRIKHKQQLYSFNRFSFLHVYSVVYYDAKLEETLLKDLRNLSVLMCAAREGRLFLYNFVYKSSFMHLLQDEKRFSKYATSANAVFKTVQIGNRSLQNMSVYAKTKKCAVLLRQLPELRALSELFIRTVHSVMVGVDCDEAFQIGLLKSRDLDVSLLFWP